MLEKVFKAPINLFFDVTPAGLILKRFSEDVGGVEHIIHHYTHLQRMFNLFAYTLVMVYMVDRKILLLAPVMIFQLYRIYTYSIGSYKEIIRVHESARNPIIQHITETVDGNSTIRAFRSQQQSISQINQEINDFILSQQVTCSTHIWYSIEVSKMGFIAMAFSAISCILAKSYTDPIMLAITFQKVLHLSGILCGLIHAMANLEGIMAKVQRCFVILDIPEEKQGQREVQDKQWPQKGEISISDVKLRYRPNTEEVLKGLSVKIGAGEKVGIVGRTGAGKSTLSLALTRIVEICGGSIEIDGENISEISLEQLRRKVTIIPQDPTLFTGTLRFNIDPEGNCSDAEIEQLLTKAGLDHLSDSDLLGLKISESGDNLSSGEKSLICICRAVLRKNRLVILDEATANIDLLTEKKIQTLISEEFKECTVLTIAHRLQTIISSDKILVMSDGRAEEFDSPENLLENQSSHFTKLVNEMRKI